MKNKNKIIEWTLVIIVVLVLFVISGKVSDLLDINRRSARYLVLAIAGFIYWIIYMIWDKKNCMSNTVENYMKKEFEEIVRLCEEAIPEYGDKASYFTEPATEEEIMKWEEENNTQIPEDYKEWLRLTKTCQICSTIASLIFPQTNQPDFLPDVYVLIGYVVGDGEVLCFSKSTGRYITYFEGEVNRRYDDFREFLEGVKKDIKGEHLSVSREERMEMIKKLNEIRERDGKLVDGADE